MATEAAIRGYLLEAALAWLLRRSGYEVAVHLETRVRVAAHCRVQHGETGEGTGPRHGRVGGGWKLTQWRRAKTEKALRSWLLDRYEARELWFHSVDGMEQSRPLTASQLADELRCDAGVLSVTELYAPGKDLRRSSPTWLQTSTFPSWPRCATRTAGWTSAPTGSCLGPSACRGRR